MVGEGGKKGFKVGRVEPRFPGSFPARAARIAQALALVR